jgi:hypothetical protein
LGLLAAGRPPARPPQVKDPARRASAHEVLSHPWLRGGASNVQLPLRFEVLETMKQYAGTNKLQKAAMKVGGGRSCQCLPAHLLPAPPAVMLPPGPWQRTLQPNTRPPALLPHRRSWRAACPPRSWRACARSSTP